VSNNKERTTFRDVLDVRYLYVHAAYANTSITLSVVNCCVTHILGFYTSS